ncbi:MAG: hypothetical protein ACT6FE_04550 [Methanosarcinaceae archaeon]
MRFIEKIFGKKDVAPVPISLEFGELPAWLKVESEKRFGGLHDHIRQKYGEIGFALEGLSESKERLEAATSINDAYKQIAKAGLSNKNNVVKNLNILIDRTIIPEKITISDAAEFHINAKSGLKMLIENTIRSQQYTKALFPEEYRGVMDNLSHLDILFDELITPINEAKDKLDAYDRLYIDIDAISETTGQIEETGKNIQNIEKKFNSLKNELHDLELKLEDMGKSEEITRAHELEEQVKVIRERLSDIDSNVRLLFTPLSKALLRMEKQNISGRHKMSPENVKILMVLRDDPVSIIGNDITQFLDEMKIRIEDGTLGLKQQKINTTIKQFDVLRNSDTLSKYSNKRDSCSSDIEEAMEKLNRITIYNEKNQFEKMISNCQGKIGSTKNDLETERTHIATLTKTSEECIAELNSDLTFIFGTKIEIVDFA